MAKIGCKALAGKRIGIVTPYDSNNYGAYLQAFSTKEVLESAGADVGFLRFRDEASRKALFIRKKPRRKDLTDIRSFLMGRASGARKYEVFSCACGRFRTERLSDFIARDAFVLGSDEIWNVRQKTFRDNPTFFGYGLSNVIAYAPSVGAASAKEIEANPKCVEGLRSLNGVLVRDSKSAEVVENLTGVRPEIVLDPTFLLDWESLRAPQVEIDGPYILVYAYSARDLPSRAIKELAKARGLKIVSVGFGLSFCDEVIEPDPLSFYSLMKGAAFVFTSTFHGTIFAMLSHALFLSFPTSQKTEYLLKTFCFEERGLQPDKIVSTGHLESLASSDINYSRFEKERQTRREASIGFLLDRLQEALNDRAGGSKIVSVAKSGMCTGCAACMNSCPTQAITMVEGTAGALVPKISSEKCIACGKCDRVCPSAHPVELNVPLACYAAWAEEGVKNPSSSSGGIGYLLARKTVEVGGISFGAVDDCGKVRHARAEDVKGCQGFCGSKYVQSEIGMTYSEIREALLSGRPVFFSGTPCQVAGLRSYLGKRYDNLLTADLICHGTPSQRLLAEHRDHVVGENVSVDGVSFRDDKAFNLTFYKEGRAVYSGSVIRDSYMHCFMKGIDYRESCYECPYARGERTGDVTIGDFWGLDRSTLDIAYDGAVSVVMANTRMGFDSIRGLRGLHLEERRIEEARAGNPQLRRPTIRKASYRELCDLLATKTFDEAFEASSEWKGFKRRAYKGSAVWLLLRKLKRKVLRR